jgi:hypothetical protein
MKERGRSNESVADRCRNALLIYPYAYTMKNELKKESGKTPV